MSLQRFLMALTIGSLVAACTPSHAATPPPSPEMACPVVLDWHGLVPGRSSRQDVTRALGNPSQTGSQRFADANIPFFAYRIEDGKISTFVQDRVFFRPDGIVDWIEAVVADRDGKFHPAQETIDQLGSTVDTAYLNSNYDPSNSHQYDVLGGLDQLYVWSNCGLALDVHAICYPSESGQLQCLPPNQVMYPRTPIPSTLTMRHPDPAVGDLIMIGWKNAVLMKFLFPPTSYEGFADYYMHKIPFGLWDKFLREVGGG